jgi:putative protein-disulfide isomerase
MMNPGTQHAKAAVLNITYYTDPLCCWSWGMEPTIDALNREFANRIHWRICMSGLISDWNSFSDSVNSVSRPLQMGPVWMHAAQVAHVEIDHSIWFYDPPKSSFPACIAFKCVELQSPEYAVTYLRMLRESCMTKRINISRQEALTALAKDLSDVYPDFDIALFKDHLLNGIGKEAFREDLAMTKRNNITRFPSFVLQQTNGPSLILVGYRSYDDFNKIITEKYFRTSDAERESLSE